MREISVELSDLQKSFGRRKVLSGVDLQIGGGEIVGIVGENGAGKTTLLKIMVGLLSPDSGRMKIRGRTGYCPQDMLLFDNLTVDEHFRLFAAAYGLGGKHRRVDWERTQADMQEMLNFSDYRDTLVSELSGGTKQKLNFSLSVLHQPDVFVLDEPYSALDWESYLSFWNFAARMKESNRTIILVSHIIFDRARLDRIFELKKGRLNCTSTE